MNKEEFRTKIEELRSNLVRGACASQVAMETRCKEEAYNEVLALLDEVPDEGVDYKKLNSMLDGALSKETEESWKRDLIKRTTEQGTSELPSQNSLRDLMKV